jgi:hypothetical protein
MLMESIKNETSGFEKPLLLSPLLIITTIANKFADTDFEVEYKSFILGAKEIVKRIPILYLKLVEAGDGGREEHFLKKAVQNIHNVLFALNKFTDDYQYHY